MLVIYSGYAQILFLSGVIKRIDIRTVNLLINWGFSIAWRGYVYTCKIPTTASAEHSRQQKFSGYILVITKFSQPISQSICLYF